MKYTIDKSRRHYFFKSLFAVLCAGKPTNAWAAETVQFSDECRVHGGVFRGGVFRGGVFHGGEFHGGVFHGGEFHGGVFRGGWLPVQIQGSRHVVNCPDGASIQIGCINHPPEVWLRDFAEIGAAHNYSLEQIAEYEGYIRLVAAMIEARAK